MFSNRPMVAHHV